MRVFSHAVGEGPENSLVHARRAVWPLLLLAPFGVCVAPCVVPAFLNNFAAWRMERAMLYPLPPRTRVVWTHSDVGLLGGNGNHCDFEVRAELATRADPSAVAGVYRSRTVPLPTGVEDDMGRETIRVLVDAFAGPDAAGETHVRVSLGVYGSPAGMDLRCR